MEILNSDDLIGKIYFRCIRIYSFSDSKYIFLIHKNTFLGEKQKISSFLSNFFRYFQNSVILYNSMSTKYWPMSLFFFISYQRFVGSIWVSFVVASHDSWHCEEMLCSLSLPAMFHVMGRCCYLYSNRLWCFLRS